MVHDLTAGPSPTRLTWLAWGGVGASVDRATAVEETAIGHPEEWSDRSESVWADWRGRAPTMEFPDAPELTQAYALARDALRALYTQPDEGITGLVAGFPWYPALWCRDLAWMLPAVLWLGDRPWVEASIRTAFRFQATERIPLLGAEVGEIPMQISPGPAFLYGTSDTTLYYPDLVRRWLDHGGPIDGGRSVWPHLLAIAGWAAAKTDPRSGLFTNGGEVEEIRAATAQIGSIHYGFDAVDTTIWDSTDRRDHAIDVQVLYVSALRALAELGTRLGESSDLPGAGAAANRVAGAIASSYAWRDEGYLYDSLRKAGTPEQKVRPNALRAVSAGLLDPDTGLAIVRRAARDDLTTPWGLRTLSARAPTYSPTAYHDGQVWTIATAWAAESALAVGEPELALRYLQIIAGHIVAENGLANECYRGDRDEPFDSCFLLGFSVAPFLTVLFERLWGLVLRADRRELAVRPTFPKGWAVARLRHLSVADGFVDLDWSPEGLEVRWTGPGRLTTTYAASTIVLDGPGTGRLDAAPP
ncbi:MAG: hypothetical protein L3J91_02580 [Thermoplasmata archaeon]|nr:hypothetical protein [Thermoplasmata archaeon]